MHYILCRYFKAPCGTCALPVVSVFVLPLLQIGLTARRTFLHFAHTITASYAICFWWLQNVRITYWRLLKPFSGFEHSNYSIWPSDLVQSLTQLWGVFYWIMLFMLFTGSNCFEALDLFSTILIRASDNEKIKTFNFCLQPSQEHHYRLLAWTAVRVFQLLPLLKQFKVSHHS